MSTRPDFDFDADAAFDDRLRAAFEPSGPPPPPPLGVWAGLQPQLTPSGAGVAAAPPTWRLRVGRPLLTATLGALLMLALMLMWPSVGSRGSRAGRTPVIAEATQAPKAPHVVEASAGTAISPLAARPSAPAAAARLLAAGQSGQARAKEARNAMQSAVPPPWNVTAGAPIFAQPLAPATPRVVVGSTAGASPASPPAIPVVLLALVSTEQAFAAVPADSGRLFRERRRAALLAQRAELARLRFRTDSLLLTLGEPLIAPPAALATDSLTPPAARPLTNRWSVALSFAPERNFFGLQAAATDTVTALRRTHEQGRAGYNAALLAEYRVNDRLSVGAGLGLTSYGAELRLADRHTSLTATYDTATTYHVQSQTVTTAAYSVPLVLHLNPRYNANAQVIGFDSVWVPSTDTTWTRLTSIRTDSVTTRTITPTLTKREELNTRVLRPNYRFLTVPLLVRYRLGRDPLTGTGGFGSPASRWWADVALGAQVQLFLGGTQLASADGGRSWRTERVQMGNGPFRPVTVALTGALTLNYALTPKLAASVAPTVRYQTESLYKASTGLTQRPAATGVQLGLRYSF